MYGHGLIPKPKGWKDLGPKSPIQWICREWVKKLDSNKLDNDCSGSKWQENKNKLVLSRENHPQLNLRRLFLVYISFKFDYKSSSCFYSVFLSIFRSPSFRGFFHSYTILFLPSPPSTCRSSCWLWSLSYQHLPEVSGSSCKAENYCSGITSTLMRSES